MGGARKGKVERWNSGRRRGEETGKQKEPRKDVGVVKGGKGRFRGEKSRKKVKRWG